MKKLLVLLSLCVSLFADIKVDLIELKYVDYPNGSGGATIFRIICINGYQWLQTGEGQGRSISQMFNNNSVNGAVVSKAISCENK